MPKLRSETFSPGDQSWLGSTHGIGNARTETVDISTFTQATHYPNGYIPSGTPVAEVGGLLVAYDATETVTTGAGVLAGHILTDQPVVGTSDFPAPLLDHGRVKASRVPGGFTTPTDAAKLGATTIVYI